MIFDAKALADAIVKKIGRNTEPKRIEHGVWQYPNGEYEINVSKSEFFAHRLSDAFPGLRGLVWMTDAKAIVDRLEILLCQPLIFERFPGKREEYGGRAEPMWWFRAGASMYIERFQRLSDVKCLIDYREYVIDKVAVYRDVADYRSFIYVETKAEPTTGVYGDRSEYLAEMKDRGRYAIEQYALYEGIPITTEEHDDGAAIINNKIVKTAGKAISMVRCLTPYNFIICAQSAVYNSNQSDKLFGDFMDDVIKGKDSHTLKDLLPTLLELPREIAHRIDFDLYD